MKLYRKIAAVAGGVVLALGILVIILLARPPVLVVSDLSCASLYGVGRIRLAEIWSCAVLFRRVKTIAIADDAGEDIVQAAITSASSRPFCVLFPLRFARTARQYREQNPEIPVVILEGRYPLGGTNPVSFAINNISIADYFIYTTDITADFYRAGIAAAILDEEKNGKAAVIFESHVQRQGREAFSRALKDQEKTMEARYYTSFSQFGKLTDLSCVILAGNGAEYLEKNADVPVIFFTWINPSMIPVDVVLVFDDSPWIQAVPAVRMVAAGMKQGQIPSKITLLPAGGMDRSTRQKLKNNLIKLNKSNKLIKDDLTKTG
jgi:hypothetical protein